MKVGIAVSLAVVALSAPLVTGCSAQSKQAATQTGGAMQSTSTRTATETQPVVQPLTGTERRWVNTVHRIRPRIDKAFQREMTLTRASMQSLVHVLGTCRETLRRAGAPGKRLREAAVLVRKACARYAVAAKHLRRAISVSGISGAVLAGSTEDAIFRSSLDHAFSAQGNASNAMVRAEETADRIRTEIDSQAS
jgi:hypothetical protein